MYFYPRSPCGERHEASTTANKALKFLSTLSLRRATFPGIVQFGFHPHFYPRSPCGERQLAACDGLADAVFLSTLSLRRATGISTIFVGFSWDFYPRSPCGERLFSLYGVFYVCIFLSTLSLRRATDWPPVRDILQWISIHALLAESDRKHIVGTSQVFQNFYPRSPCGERPIGHPFATFSNGFLSTLSLRRATFEEQIEQEVAPISIHALLAESDNVQPRKTEVPGDFYPRSPCGERRHFIRLVVSYNIISIHALLAESDKRNALFLSTLPDFYPRSPCGERRSAGTMATSTETFLSTLSLRRATACRSANTGCP